MKKIFAIILFSVFFISSFYCKSKFNGDNFVKFKIEAPQTSDITESRFKVADYKFRLDNIYVMDGSVCGLIIEFNKIEDENSSVKLTFRLPSSDSFRILSDGIDYVSQVPEIPCTITHEDFKGVKSTQSKNEVRAFISLARSIKESSDHVQIESVNFEIFKLDIKELEIENDELNFECTFSGKLSETQKSVQDLDYSISGEFSVRKSEIQQVLVDD